MQSETKTRASEAIFFVSGASSYASEAIFFASVASSDALDGMFFVSAASSDALEMVFLMKDGAVVTAATATTLWDVVLSMWNLISASLDGTESAIFQVADFGLPRFFVVGTSPSVMGGDRDREDRKPQLDAARRCRPMILPRYGFPSFVSNGVLHLRPFAADFLGG